MSFTEAITSVFSNYINFSGRARRSEYWYFVAFNTLVNTILGALARTDFASIAGILSTVYSLAIIIPFFAVTWRRYHDIGRSGLWSLIVLVPIIGWILCIYWTCKDSEPGENQYGPCPKDY